MLFDSIIQSINKLFNLKPVNLRALLDCFVHCDSASNAVQAELGENLYSHDSERDSNAIEALVGRLRRKLKTDVIETRRGFGYVVASAMA